MEFFKFCLSVAFFYKQVQNNKWPEKSQNFYGLEKCFVITIMSQITIIETL